MNEKHTLPYCSESASRRGRGQNLPTFFQGFFNKNILIFCRKSAGLITKSLNRGYAVKIRLLSKFRFFVERKSDGKWPINIGKKVTHNVWNTLITACWRNDWKLSEQKWLGTSKQIGHFFKNHYTWEMYLIAMICCFPRKYGHFSIFLSYFQGAF